MPFPAQSTVLDEEAMLMWVVGEYRIAEPASCRFFCRGDADVYLVGTGAGDRYLKIYRPPHTAAMAEAEAAFVADLAGRGVAVVPAVPKKDDRYATWIEASEGRRPALLFEAAPPETVRLDEPAPCAEVGAALAGLHDAADAMETTHGLPAHEPGSHLGAAARLLPPDTVDYLEGLLGEIDARLADLPATAPDFGPCHGDLVPSNLRRDADGRLTFFDFGGACLTRRTWELAVVRLCLRKDPGGWDALLEGYSAVRPLPAGFEEHLPDFLLLRRISWLTGVLATCPLRLGVENFGPAFVDEVVADIRSLAG
jgi:Ser/Thr protein kinase RdoA (MazF antagonist)